MADKLAIVTGASTGIGFELATLAAKDGYDLIVVADEPLIDAAAQDFKQFGTDVQSVQADLATFEGVDTLLAAAGGRRVDLLVANAGIGAQNQSSPRLPSQAPAMAISVLISKPPCPASRSVSSSP
jgi:short-subunit dehydrogenase